MKTREIDAELSEWHNQPSLRLDREEYTAGSFNGHWTPNDLSVQSWLVWDEENLYFAARVQDQTASQQYTGELVWKQDSIQLLFALPGQTADTDIVGIWLALTPDGSQVWRQSGGPRGGQLVTDCKVAIRYHNQSYCYELALPWSELGEEFIEVPYTRHFRFGMAVNDDDAIIPRRFMERPLGTVVNGRNLNAFAEMTLLSDGFPQVLDGRCCFEDDFTGYPAWSVPVGYIHRHSGLPDNTGRVEPNAGEASGTPALVLRNTVGLKSHVFCTLGDIPPFHPGQKYRLEVRLKGTGGNNAKLGFATDFEGWHDYQYLTIPPEVKEWTTFSLEFTGPSAGATPFYFLIKNERKIPELAIDSIKIVEIE